MKRSAAVTTAIAIACAVLAIPSAAQAQAPTDPLVFDSMAPADGATIAAGSAPTFQMTSNAGYTSVWAEVATQPTLGQDGTLATDFTVQNVPLSRSDANPTAYSGAASSAPRLWSSTPGVYYWQAYSMAGRVDPNTHQYIKPVGPVQRIVVTAPSAPVVTAPPAPAVQLTVSEGARFVQDGLKRRFGSRYPRARNVKVTYTRRSATTIDYRVSWQKRGVRYSGTVKVRKTATNYTYTVNVAPK